ncbi:hypothetical protein [Dyadobacter pollutisoli]|uniref:Uncharacterized protein n=1 Tax=Dyadobacter pollutisoli TaxID=2910158 RepID=A0A9E8N7L0_9BACT|nr:hypothetical protein [Dyadobacter pollutisoli]WAC09387.1 hypothetical protein ON006_16670 [Dyadobacter pollutisoli]
MKLKVSLFLILAVASAGCVDIPDFDDTPKIYYNGIDQYTETDTVSNVEQKTEYVTITIDFEDGDGDLGASADDVNDSTFWQKYEKVPGWGMPANYQLVTMRMNKDSSWSETVLPGDTFKFFPVLKPDGKPGPIKGKLDLVIPFRYLKSAVLTKIKFKVRIIDRAFHISNQTPETDIVTVPVLQ